MRRVYGGPALEPSRARPKSSRPRGACRMKLTGMMVAALCATLAGPAAAERLYAPREIRQDFATMYRGLKSAHVDLYAFTPKSELDAFYAKELAGFDTPLNEIQVKDRFEQFLSHIHMGHTRIDFPYDQKAAYK